MSVNYLLIETSKNDQENHPKPPCSMQFLP